MAFDLDKQKILPVDIEEEMKKSFISYAMATIINRALPDVRDGLKPVHRRILYAMHELGVPPDKPHRKCARIVGDVMGKYHPHGDMAIYETLVRMAQDFSIRYMLVDGHGNFGSIDGDSAASMRYTEARLSKISMEMLRDIDKETVDFAPNFDETELQPVVLPSRYPNLLVNGSGGIAVGMATNIPPHNLGEVIRGVFAMMDNPDITTDELMEFIPGPDFPTGALIMGRAGIQQAYRTGRGRVVMRAKVEIEDMGNSRSRILIREIPYMVNKARLVEKMAELVQQKRLEGVSDIREESDRQGMRVVVELKRDVNPHIVLNFLYKHTQMQETFGIIMLALVDSEPKILSLKMMLRHYLDHQMEVVTRRTQYDLAKDEARAHIVEGLIRALDFIDEIIALIRGSKTTSDARDGLMNEFGFSEKQAQAILDMRLQRLTGLEYEKLQQEFAELMGRIAYYKSILADEQLLLSIIRGEMQIILDKFGDDRRTEIQTDPSDIDLDDIIQVEDMVVAMTRLGYIKRMAVDVYRTQHRGGVGVSALTTRDEDFVERILVTSTHDWLLFFTNQGRVHRLRCYQIPEASRQARGSNIVNLLQMEPGEVVQTIIPLEQHFDPEGSYLLLATRGGMVKKTPLEEYENLKNVGLRAINLQEGDELIVAQLTDGNREVVIATREGMSIRFNEGQIRPMHRVSTGVMGIKLREGDYAVDLDILEEGKELLALTEKGYGKRTDYDEYRAQGRNGMGIRSMNLTEKTGKLVALKLVDNTKDVMMITSDGTVIRTAASNIPTIGRATQGVRVMRLRGTDTVTAVAIVDSVEEELAAALPADDLEKDVSEDVTE